LCLKSKYFQKQKPQLKSRQRPEGLVVGGRSTNRTGQKEDGRDANSLRTQNHMKFSVEEKEEKKASR